MKHTKKRMVTAMTALVLTTLMLLSIAGCKSDPSSSGTASSSQSGQSPTSGVSPSNQSGQSPASGVSPSNQSGQSPASGVSPSNQSGQSPASGVSPVQPVQDTNSPIDSLRAYMYPSGDVPVFSIEQQNYSQAMPLISYDVFDCENIILNRLTGQITSTQELDSNNDGTSDRFAAMGDNFIWVLSDNNYDGKYDYCRYEECNFSHLTSNIDCRVEWYDHDGNGTMDQVIVRISNQDDIYSGKFTVQYTYGDYSDIDFDTGSANFTNEGRIQYIEAAITSETSTILEVQKFRDMDGNGLIDWVQLERWYDTNNDGIKESLKTLYDRDADGVFEDEGVYNGKIFDESLLY